LYAVNFLAYFLALSLKTEKIRCKSSKGVFTKEIKALRAEAVDWDQDLYYALRGIKSPWFLLSYLWQLAEFSPERFLPAHQLMERLVLENRAVVEETALRELMKLEVWATRWGGVRAGRSRLALQGLAEILHKNGFPRLMEELWKSNPALRTKFNKMVDFDDRLLHDAAHDHPDPEAYWMFRACKCTD
jgi:hypothetical protein